MPAGDPAGYLPNVVKARLKKKGQKQYKPRSKQAPPGIGNVGRMNASADATKDGPSGFAERRPPRRRGSGGGRRFFSRP